MYKQIIYSFLLSLLIVSCGGDNSSSPNVENSSNSHSSEIPCDATNEGTIIKPTDSDVEHICKGGSWIAIGSSSSSSNIISNETRQSSSSVKSVILSSDSDELSISSSSSVIASETKQSSSSGYDNDDSSSSSSEEPVESSSSEETKLYLCEDGETYVLDPANCEKVSSSSVVFVSSSSDNKPNSSSGDVQESSSSEMSSSSVKTESSSSKAESSSSEVTTQSSSENVDDSSSSEDSVESSSSEINTASSSSLNSVYDAVNNTLTDLRDGQIYKTVTIGTQVWMAENLNYLPKDTSGTIWAGKSLCGGGEWKKTAEGDCSIYGRLYESKFTDTDSYRKELCPNGWSLPTKKQYETLISFLGDKAIDKMKIQNSSYWNISESITSSGFAAIPAGYYTPYGGFNDQENVEKSVAYFGFIYNSKNIIAIIEDRTDFRWTTFGTAYYMSIRCIKE